MLNLEEGAHVLVHCGPRLKPIVLTALHTGFRKSALLSLTWDDVDFRHRVVTIRATYAEMGKREACR
jgi:integrase